MINPSLPSGGKAPPDPCFLALSLYSSSFRHSWPRELRAHSWTPTVYAACMWFWLKYSSPWKMHWPVLSVTSPNTHALLLQSLCSDQIICVITVALHTTVSLFLPRDTRKGREKRDWQRQPGRQRERRRKSQGDGERETGKEVGNKGM